MRTGCTDVCEIITGNLIKMGFKIDTVEDNHDDVIESLGQCKLVHTVSEALDFIRNEAVDRDEYALGVWCIEDVLERAKERGKKLSKAQAKDAISLIDRHHDCDNGISWITIDCAIDEVL